MWIIETSFIVTKSTQHHFISKNSTENEKEEKNRKMQNFKLTNEHQNDKRLNPKWGGNFEECKYESFSNAICTSFRAILKLESFFFRAVCLLCISFIYKWLCIWPVIKLMPFLLTHSSNTESNEKLYYIVHVHASFHATTTKIGNFPKEFCLILPGLSDG